MGDTIKKIDRQALLHDIAIWISIIFHPFLVTCSTTFWIVYLDRQDPVLAAYWCGWFVLIVVLPAAGYLLLKLKKNEFSDPDVSIREQRKPFYFFGGSCLILYFVSVLLFPGPKSLALLTAAALFNVICFGAVTFYFTKISIHVGMIVGFTVAALYFSEKAFFILLFVSILVSWSRLLLKRHTPFQIGLSWILSTFWVVIFYGLWL